MKTINADVFREFERELSYPLFFGVSLGAALNDTLVIKFLNGHHIWSLKNLFFTKLLIVRHYYFPKSINGSLRNHPKGKFLIALLDATPRVTELVLPVLEELNRGDCVVLCGNDNVVPLVPNDVPCIVWNQVLSYVVKDWRLEYRRCKSEWVCRLKSISRKYQLARGAVAELELSLMISSQQVTGCIALLKQTKPAVVITDYDRNAKWSSLVLAAKLLNIPTVTLVHGVMSEGALGFSPVIADTIVCWGEFHQEILLAAGEPPAKIFIGGCPRLSPDLPAFSSNCFKKFSLNPQKPVIIFATSPELQRLQLTEIFCSAVAKLDFVSGMVRLHPSEKLITYQLIIDRYPVIIFFESNQATLDESLALASVVVCRSSGLGSDALVKGVNVVVLDVETEPSGHGGDLIKSAGCPHARTDKELTEIINKIIFDDTFRQQLAIRRKAYVEHFCGAFGKDSAVMTADFIRRQVVCP